MTKRNPLHDLRGVSRLAVDATAGITGVVEAMHVTIAEGPALLGRPLRVPMRVVLRPIYGGLRAVTRLVGGGIDVALGQLAGLLDASVASAEHEAVVAALCGVLGDHLCETGNPLAITMRLRKDGHALELTREALAATFSQPSAHVVVLVHGSCSNDLQWRRGGHDHGAALERDLAASAVYVHYNSGLHVSTNGALLSEQLEQLVVHWPVAIERLSIVGHSMGGLVARAAIAEGERAGQSWRRVLSDLVTLGTPHHGAPLERGGNWIDVLLGVSRYSAPLGRLGRIRSAGVTDLRYGSVSAEDWMGRDRFAPSRGRQSQVPLPDDVRCFAIAASLDAAPGTRGDGLVPIDSALGRSPTRALGFPEAHQWIAYATGHLDLLDRPEVYATLLRSLER